MRTATWIRVFLAAFSVSLVASTVPIGCNSGTERSEQSPEEENRQASEVSGDEVPEQAHDRVEIPLEALKSISLKTAPVKRRAIVSEIRATATIRPNETRIAEVSPRVPGRVENVFAFLGDQVKEGEKLAELDSLELGRTKAAYLATKATLDVARANYEREERLYQRRISSEREFLEAKGEFLRAEAQFRASREALRLLGLKDDEVEELRWGGSEDSLAHFPLLAPFDGTIIEKHIVVGELVEPEEKPFVIADLSTVWVLIDIYERDLARVHEGAKVRIVLDSYPDKSLPGKIAYISSIINEDTRTARARVEIKNASRELRPGMFASVTIALPAAEGRKALVIPRGAIQRMNGEPVAFVEEKPGVYALRELVIGEDSGTYVEVRSGLDEGEPLVTQGAFYLKSSLLKEEMGGHGH